MVDLPLVTIQDYENFLKEHFSIKPENITILKANPGTVVIIIYKQKLRVWWHRKKIKKFLNWFKPAGFKIDITLAL